MINGEPDQRPFESAERTRAASIEARFQERLAPLETRIPPPVLSAIREIRRESQALAEQFAATKPSPRRVN